MTNLLLINEVLHVVGNNTRINHEGQPWLKGRVISPTFACTVAETEVGVQRQEELVQPPE
jgi:hypothetical protein